MQCFMCEFEMNKYVRMEKSSNTLIPLCKGHIAYFAVEDLLIYNDGDRTLTKSGRRKILGKAVSKMRELQEIVEEMTKY